MRRFWKRFGSMALAALVAGALATSVLADEKKKEFAADKGADKVEVSAYPANIQAAYKVFASKCSKCHTLARPINTNMKADGWKMYVKRMANKPDSGISPAQAKQVYSFLKFYQAEKDKKKSAQ